MHKLFASEIQLKCLKIYAKKFLATVAMSSIHVSLAQIHTKLHQHFFYFCFLLWEVKCIHTSLPSCVFIISLHLLVRINTHLDSFFKSHKFLYLVSAHSCFKNKSANRIICSVMKNKPELSQKYKMGRNAKVLMTF